MFRASRDAAQKGSWGFNAPDTCRLHRKLRPGPRSQTQTTQEAQNARVVRLLSNAVEWENLLDSGQVTDQTKLGRREGVTHARVTQVMGLPGLAPENQEHVLSKPETAAGPAVTERALRAIAHLWSPRASLVAVVTLPGRVE